MTDDRLFDLDEIPEVPIFREPRSRKGPARGSRLDDRLAHDYPPEWSRCPDCDGRGRLILGETAAELEEGPSCPRCLGMGSVKARVRREAGHRCLRCRHPFMPKGDARKLGVEPSPGRWSPCDELCDHYGPLRVRVADGWTEYIDTASTAAEWTIGSETDEPAQVEGEWRILTVHHADGDKANLAWWNLLALCQRCHLEIQAKVVMERVYLHPHSEWFRPFVAGYYAWAYLGEQIDRDEAEIRMEELLALELDPSYER